MRKVYIPFILLHSWQDMVIDKERYVSFFLRTGLAIAFLYAAVASFLNPQGWIFFFPAFVRSLSIAQPLLFVFCAYQILLALWLLSGKRTFYAAVASSATLLLIILSNINALDIVFRDVMILFSAAALVVVSMEKRK